MKTIGEMHERNAHLYPDREAVIFQDQRVTYSALLTRIRQLSSAIEQTGAKAQHRIGLLSTNNVECFEVFGAAEWGGFIAAAFNFRSAGLEIEHLIADSAPSIVFFEATFAPLIAPLVSRFGGILAWVSIGGPAGDWAVDYETFIARGDLTGGSLRARPEDWVHLFYTSGTTGKPKGVPVRHGSALRTAQHLVNEQDQQSLQMTPMFHVGGRGPTLSTVWATGKIVLHKGFDATAFLRAVQDERVNVTFMVAPMIQEVIDHPDLENYDLTSLRWVMSASAPIPEPLLHRALEKLGNVFYLSYGSTEGGAIARMRRSETTLSGGAEQIRRLRSVGQFEPWREAKLLDDDGNEVPQGEVGEVCVVPDSFEQYWNNSVATIEAMHGRFFRTGDMGRLDERGYLYLVDRKKDMIISGGENIYSREVEDAIESHPDVQEAAVIGQPDPKWGEKVVALVQLRPGRELDQVTLSDYLKTRIARYKCPKDITYVVDMPRHGTGKIDKVAIRRSLSPVD